ncbi:Fe2+-dependent dioxygenase [Pseudomonas sp. PDM16]|uniref:Fe2+-dependent dioxygenase n=1 Tax=Pseudomonas sp. PDM16 TaxID=2769292 RepID=UPI0017805C8C|nr:Fe2+-dependent dioxygenase [Pseudomonas sp. PDM16]MBD9416871.1 Fe2+-dependent dioxygenase [Pseudomonas sp. PDM16]
MLLHIPQVLDRQTVIRLREELTAQPWQDGCVSAGPQAKGGKENLQFPPDSPAYPGLAGVIADALARNPLFQSAALPRHVLPPMFNCYQGGGRYGNHVDNALQRDRFSGLQVRTDVSTTVFLSDPEEYEGGELIVEDTYGEHEVKLAAGDAIVYPATSLHRVEPVTSGMRLASFLWTQSWVRDAWQRKMLFDMDMAIIKLRSQLGDSDEVLSLTSTYHNLLRQWGE